jgi:hypothetical protein
MRLVGPHPTWPVTPAPRRDHHVLLRVVCESVTFRLPAPRVGVRSFTPLPFTAVPTDRRGIARGATLWWSRRCPLLPDLHRIREERPNGLRISRPP